MISAARLFMTAAAVALAGAGAGAASAVLAQGVPADQVLQEIQEPDAVDPEAPPPVAPGTGDLPEVPAEPAPDSSFEEEFSSVIRGDRVVLRGLNKVTAQTRDFPVGFNQPLQFGSLTVLARTCSRRPPELIPETFVFLEIYDRTFDGAETTEYGQKIFSGWMLGSSPALHGLEHPVYDIWPVSCHAPGDADVAAQAAAVSEAAEEAAEQDDEAAGTEVFVD